MDNSTSNYYSRAMQKKKMQSRAGFLDDRSIRQLTEIARITVFSASIVINAQKDEISPFERLNHDETC